MTSSVACSNPTECQWGQKAFQGYLSSPSSEGKKHDSTLLLPTFPKDEKMAIKVNYGTGDKFYKDGQLLPENFEKAAKEAGREGEVEIGRREGYDHSSVLDRDGGWCEGGADTVLVMVMAGTSSLALLLRSMSSSTPSTSRPRLPFKQAGNGLTKAESLYKKTKLRKHDKIAQ